MRSNAFHTRCISKGNVCSMIIDSESFENCVSMEIVQKLDLKMIPLKNIFFFKWEMISK